MSEGKGARRFRRAGMVTARQLPEPRDWVTKAGDTLHGKAGDWLVEGPDGAERTVADEKFRASYEEIAPGQYRRVGVVTARQVSAGESVATLEGSATARPGDWVVTDAGGDSWPVPDAQIPPRLRGGGGLAVLTDVGCGVSAPGQRSTASGHVAVGGEDVQVRRDRRDRPLAMLAGGVIFCPGPATCSVAS